MTTETKSQQQIPTRLCAIDGLNKLQAS